MMLVVAVLLTLGTVDLVRWSPDAASTRRTGVALAAGVGAAFALAVLGVGTLGGAAAIVVAGAGSALVWVAAGLSPFGREGTTALAAITVIAAVVLVAVPYGPPLSGPLDVWYSDLALPGLSTVPALQALVAGAGLVFLLSTGNRIVRLVLAAAGTPPITGEASLRGGRILGPLERIFILALALGGDLTAPAIVIAAKGVLRLPEIRSAQQREGGRADLVTEYFLVGTFSSWLLAVMVAGLVAVAG